MINEAINGVGIVGENARKSLATEIARNPGAFPEGLGDRLNEITPEGKADRIKRDAIAIELEAQELMDAIEDAIGTPAEIIRRRNISISLEEQSQNEAIEEDQKRVSKMHADAIRGANIAVDLEEAFQMQAEEEANGPARFGTKRARERDKEWDQLEGMDERGGDLNWRLRGLLMRGAAQSNSFGDADSYEASIKATSAEAQLKKLHDINEVLKDIKKNTEARTKLVERIAR
jgi:hypothetical protein